MTSHLRPAAYQLVGLTKLLQSELGGLLIADGVGVGKTIAAGYILSRRLTTIRAPVAVVSPPGLVNKWILELRGKFGLRAHPLRSDEELATARAELASGASDFAYVLPYSMMADAATLPTSTIVIDEIHNMRNPETRAWKLARALSSRSAWRVGLSATPINNSMRDLSAIYALLLPNFNPYVVDAVISEAWSEDDYRLLDPILTRFTKEQLGIHFARRQVESIRIQYPESYGTFVRRTIEQLTGRRTEKERYPMAAITYFREAASSPPAFAMDVLGDPPLAHDPKQAALQEILDHEAKALVFCEFVETANYLARTTPNHEPFVLSGDVPLSDRESIVEAFKASDRAVLYLTSVGTEGLDFQFCDVVVNYDLHWNPMILEQRVGRIDRIGQKKDTIRIYNFHVTGSIDDRVLTVLSRKLADVSGTPLSPPPIVADYEPLYDEPAGQSQLHEAKKAVESLRLSSQLQTRDIEIISDIDLSACHPPTLAQFADLQWLRQTEAAYSWRSRLREEGSRLHRNLKTYQRVVAPSRDED